MGNLNCNHIYQTILGSDFDLTKQDNINTQRFCTACGLIGIYSTLDKRWVDVGYMHEHFPEELEYYGIQEN